MGSEWEEVQLQNIVSKLGDGLHGTPEYSEDGDYYFINGNNLDNGNITLKNDTKRVSFSEYEKYKKILNKNTLLVSINGTIGNVAYYNDEPVILGKSACYFNLNEDVSRQFIRYILSSSAFLHYLESYSTGTTIKNVSLKMMREFSFKLPPLSEQKAIAHILGSLDDKIELNRQMNATLEEMAQALFKSWFVDFDPVIDNAIVAGNEIPEELAERAEVRRKALADGTANREAAEVFPAAFQLTEEMGWIPEGWEVKKLKDICDRIFSGGTPRTKNSEYWNGSIPWLSSGETRQHYILMTDKSITRDGVNNSSTREARKGAVVIASAGQGKTRGQTSYLCFDSYINQSVIAIEANNSIIPDTFLFFDLARRYEEFRQLSDAHSSRGSLTTKLLYEINVVMPDINILSKFNEITNEVVKKITTNERLKLSLSELRDTLLPKLLSGELRIPEAEKLVGEALE